MNRRLAKAIAALEDVPEPLVRLDAVREAREALEALEADTARQARDGGATWSQIGALYGVSKQAAQQRFRVIKPKKVPADEPLGAPAEATAALEPVQTIEPLEPAESLAPGDPGQ